MTLGREWVRPVSSGRGTSHDQPALKLLSSGGIALQSAGSLGAISALCMVKALRHQRR